jgi:hypothetical protein
VLGAEAEVGFALLLQVEQEVLLDGRLAHRGGSLRLVRSRWSAPGRGATSGVELLQVEREYAGVAPQVLGLGGSGGLGGTQRGGERGLCVVAGGLGGVTRRLGVSELLPGQGLARRGAALGLGLEQRLAGLGVLRLGLGARLLLGARLVLCPLPRGLGGLRLAFGGLQAGLGVSYTPCAVVRSCTVWTRLLFTFFLAASRADFEFCTVP